jgi:hypothetical protein
MSRHPVFFPSALSFSSTLLLRNAAAALVLE